MILGVRPAGRGPWVGLSGVTAASGGATLWRCPAQLLAAAGTERAVAMARLRPRRRAHRHAEPAALQGWGSQLCPRTRCPHTCCVATAGGRAAERSVTTLGSRRPHPPGSDLFISVTWASMSSSPCAWLSSDGAGAVQSRAPCPGAPLGPDVRVHAAPAPARPPGLLSGAVVAPACAQPCPPWSPARRHPAPWSLGCFS